MRFKALRSRAAREGRDCRSTASHRRIEPVALGELQGKAFGEVAAQTSRQDRKPGNRQGPSARRRSSAPKRRRDLVRRFRRGNRPACNRRRPDARLSSECDDPLYRVGEGEGDLLADMVAQAKRAAAAMSSMSKSLRSRRPNRQPEDADFHCAVKVGSHAARAAPGSSGNRFSSELSSFSEMASERPWRPRSSAQASPAGASPRAARGRLRSRQTGHERRRRRALLPVRASGLRSISSSTKRSSSVWVSCSSLIDCISCGVITSDWDCRELKFGGQSPSARSGRTPDPCACRKPAIAQTHAAIQSGPAFACQADSGFAIAIDRQRCPANASKEGCRIFMQMH
jgi:hypothetical protein